jgi:hypothetical protein
MMTGGRSTRFDRKCGATPSVSDDGNGQISSRRRGLLGLACHWGRCVLDYCYLVEIFDRPSEGH